jgi:tetratricopeptide (TPR) repeat protein
MRAEGLRRPVAFVGAAILAITAPATASVPAKPPPHVTPTPKAIVAAAATRAQAGDCPGALALLDPLAAASAPGSDARVSAQLLRMPCLASAGRSAEVAPVLAELKRTAPANPLVQGYQIFIDTDAGRFADAADGLAALADARSQALTLVPGDLWRAVAQQLTITKDYARRDRTALALAQAEWQPADHPDLAESLAADGVGTLLDRQDIDDARPLLDRVVRPGALWNMAIERRFAALWPDIEARLGPEGGVAADRYALRALAAYADQPTDDVAIRDAVRAFLALGRFDDVVQTAAPVAVTVGMSEDRVEIVLGAAQALAAGGDPAGAVKRLQPFGALDLSHTPDAAMALIALAETLDQASRYDEELTVARSALATKADYYSPFGLAWLRRSETCALSALHRDADAKTSGDALKAATADNDAAAIEGLLCAGRDDEAATIAIAALATSEGTDRVADQFQPGGAIYADAPSRLRNLWVRLLRRADVNAAFDKTARILPKPLWPAKASRAVPIAPGDGATT